MGKKGRYTMYPFTFTQRTSARSRELAIVIAILSIITIPMALSGWMILQLLAVGLQTFVSVAALKELRQHRQELEKSKTLFDLLDYEGSDEVRRAASQIGISFDKSSSIRDSDGFHFNRNLDNMEPRSFGRLCMSLLHIEGMDYDHILEAMCRQIVERVMRDRWNNGLYWQSPARFLKEFSAGAASSRHDSGQKVGEVFYKILEDRDRQHQQATEQRNLKEALEAMTPRDQAHQKPSI